MEPEWAAWVRENMPAALYEQAKNHWARTGEIITTVTAENDRLLEALEELVDLYEYEDNVSRDARAAIAKARGNDE